LWLRLNWLWQRALLHSSAAVATTYATLAAAIAVAAAAAPTAAAVAANTTATSPAEHRRPVLVPVRGGRRFLPI